MACCITLVNCYKGTLGHCHIHWRGLWEARRWLREKGGLSSGPTENKMGVEGVFGKFLGLNCEELNKGSDESGTLEKVCESNLGVGVCPLQPSKYQTGMCFPNLDFQEVVCGLYRGCGANAMQFFISSGDVTVTPCVAGGNSLASRAWRTILSFTAADN